VVWQTALATLGLAALSAACQGFGITRMSQVERWGMALAGLLMVFPAVFEAAFGNMIPVPHLIGIALGVALVAVQVVRNKRNPAFA
jgi:TRAP-type uncharacterized transport system fused permease subunit